MSNQLTDSQLVILSAASRRTCRSILPLPPTLTLNKGSAALVLKSLLFRGLIAEETSSLGDDIWREGEDGGRLTLKMTAAADRALGLEADESGALPSLPERPTASQSPTDLSPAAPKPIQPASGTKLAIILDLLRREEGASLDELVAATGWQAHSVRGAISGSVKRKLGLPVETFPVEERGRIYRIAGAEAAPAMVESAS